MKSKQFILLVVAFLLLIATPRLFADSPENEAVKAAKVWLSLVDDGKYGPSWDQAAELFKEALSRDKWEQALAATRKPMGNMISRKLESARHVTSLPGAPDGDYIVIRFDTSYTNKTSAIETITPMKDKDGIWRVSGYFIK
jgi:hypothetical protein